MTLAALRVEIQKPDYTGMTDVEIASVLNTRNIAVVKDVATAEVHGVFLASGEWPGIVMAAEPASGAPTAVRGLCILVRDTLALRQNIEMSKADRREATVQVLNGLVAASLIAPATRDFLLSMSNGTTSRAEQLGLSYPVTLGDIQTARN